MLLLEHSAKYMTCIKRLLVLKPIFGLFESDPFTQAYCKAHISLTHKNSLIIIVIFCCSGLCPSFSYSICLCSGYNLCSSLDLSLSVLSIVHASVRVPSFVATQVFVFYLRLSYCPAQVILDLFLSASQPVSQLLFLSKPLLLP